VKASFPCHWFPVNSRLQTWPAAHRGMPEPQNLQRSGLRSRAFWEDAPVILRLLRALQVEIVPADDALGVTRLNRCLADERNLATNIEMKLCRITSWVRTNSFPILARRR